MPPGPVTAATLEAMVDNFHTLHERLYSYNLPEANVDLVNLRVSATGALPRHEMSRLPDANGSSPSPESTRKVMFSRSDGYVDTAIYDRGSLGSGAVVHGPAIIEQSDTTTLLTPSYAAKVDGYGNLVIVGSE